MKKYLLLSALFVIFFTSCKKDAPSHQVLLTSADFPNSIGSWWFYQDGNETDTVRIIDTITVINQQVQRWVQINSINPYNDTMFVIKTDSFIKFLYNNEIYNPYLTIYLPVIVNTAWGASTQAENFSTEVQNISVDNVNYSGTAYLHQTSPLVFGGSIDESIWIAKNIGIVQHFIHGAGAPQHNYELLAYHIN